MQLDAILTKLWQQYTQDSPDVKKIHQLFLDQGETVVNDHIAIRTFADKRVDVDKLAQFFLDLGYKKAGDYTFPVKKLTAAHYEHADLTQPKIFISQLELTEFSPQLQQISQQCVNNIPASLLSSAEILYSGADCWGPLDYEIYQQLLAESDYAAWLYAFGFRANHFTVSVNYMQKLNTLEKVNNLLREHGFLLNQAGGEIKGSAAELLEQSSTMAANVKLHFKQGTFEIANSYYEFAKRYPKADGSLYQGFIASSADKIFESTNNQFKQGQL